MGWVSEAEALDIFTPLQLDTFHALWNLYEPDRGQNWPHAPVESREKKRPVMSRREAMRRFPTSMKVGKLYDDGANRVIRAGQV